MSCRRTRLAALLDRCARGQSACGWELLSVSVPLESCRAGISSAGMIRMIQMSKSITFAPPYDKKITFSCLE